MEVAQSTQHKSLDELLDEIEQAGVKPKEVPVQSKPQQAQEFPLGALLSSPQAMQLMGKLPALLSLMKGESEGGGGGKAACAKPDACVLLGALRPYLNDTRKEAVDSMMRLWKLRALLYSLRME